MRWTSGKVWSVVYVEGGEQKVVVMVETSVACEERFVLRMFADNDLFDITVT